MQLFIHPHVSGNYSRIHGISCGNYTKQCNLKLRIFEKFFGHFGKLSFVSICLGNGPR